jgi:hypothetical protein
VVTRSDGELGRRVVIWEGDEHLPLSFERLGWGGCFCPGIAAGFREISGNLRFVLAMRFFRCYLSCIDCGDKCFEQII